VNPSALQGASDCAEYRPWLYWRLDAKPALVEIGRALARVNLEAVLIGNAAAGRGRRSRRLISIFLFETPQVGMSKSGTAHSNKAPFS
jgi:hypothetical protein